MRYIGNTPILPKSGKIKGNVTIKISHQYGLRTLLGSSQKATGSF